MSSTVKYKGVVYFTKDLILKASEYDRLRAENEELKAEIINLKMQHDAVTDYMDDPLFDKGIQSDIYNLLGYDTSDDLKEVWGDFQELNQKAT